MPNVAELSGIARFELLRPLGQGGMGTVFEARERATGARVALKMLHGREGATLYRFKQEFRALQDVTHPNVVRFGELFEDGGRFYLTMELVEGVSLLDYLRPGSTQAPPDLRDAAAIGGIETISSSRELTQDARRTGTQLADTVRHRHRAAARLPEVPALSDREAHDGVLDLARLRPALRQLGAGLYALHAAGFVHRDVKPQNVLVTRDARVVLLDFGLMVEASNLQPAGRELVGTIAYMAPEQANPQDVSSAADWYAFGVVLYEALTGVLPHRGDGLTRFAEGMSVPPPAPGLLAPDAPADLCELCMELLREKPEERPTGAAIAERLGFDPSVERGRAGFRSQLQFSRGTFVGRRSELKRLDASLTQSREQGSTLLRVIGESGVGKTSLLRRFSDELASTEAGIVLHGRCYEREAVPYRGLDGVIDSLGRHLRARIDCGEKIFVPRRAGLLSQVFPVLRALPVYARAPASRLAELDPYEARRLGIGALRELLAALSDHRPLLVHIDDAQWMDAESASLLDELGQGDDAPHMLLVLTQRPADDSTRVMLATLCASWQRASELVLGRLSPSESEALVGELMRERLEQAGRDKSTSSLPPSAAVHLPAMATTIDHSAIAVHSGGHPLFIHELVMHGASRLLAGGVPANESAPHEISLEAALGQRIELLDADGRRLLHLVAVASAPLSHAVLRSAAELDANVYPWVLSALRAENLISYRALAESAEVHSYHDRIRELLLAQLDDATRRHCHERIARALQGVMPDAYDVLTHHFRHAGHRATAAEYACAAGDAAMAQLAFERAAGFYRLALDAPDVTTRARIETQLGAALASAGRGSEAAEAYLRAADAAGGHHALELQRRAAEQFLRSGRIEGGLSVVASVLRELGEPIPSGDSFTVLGMLGGLIRLRLRGQHFGLKPARELTADEQLRISTCWTVSAALSVIDTLNATAFQVRHLRLALDAGHTEQAVKGMAILGATLSLVDGPPRRFALQLLETARELSSRVSSPEIEGWIALNAGIAALSSGDFRSAERSCAQAQSLFGDHCTGVAWEVVTARSFVLWSQCYQGKFRAVADALPEILAQARARGDRYALAMLTLSPLHLLGLAQDEPAQVRATIEAELPLWSTPSAFFQRMCAFYNLAHVDLYEGNAQVAWDRLIKAWGTLEHTTLMRVQFYRVDFVSLRARLALLLARQQPSERERWLAQARASASRLSGEGMAFARAFSTMLEADIAHQEGAAGLALRLLSRAQMECDAIGLNVHSALASFAAARLTRNNAARAQAELTLNTLGVRSCERMLALWMPGFANTAATNTGS